MSSSAKVSRLAGERSENPEADPEENLEPDVDDSDVGPNNKPL
ncbi:MAG: hypothetical protein QM718_06630 [Steroidobacteraceae bacterium]